MTINAQNAMLISSSTSEQCLADGVALRQQVGEAQGGWLGPWQCSLHSSRYSMGAITSTLTAVPFSVTGVGAEWCRCARLH